MRKMLRVGLTLLLVVLAITAGTWVWNHYLDSPWTRDGRIRADVVTIAPDVSGWVTELSVANNQSVDKGDLLFTIDDTRYRAEVAQAQAEAEEKRIAWEMAQHQYERRQKLTGRQTISEEDLEIYRIKTESAKASYALAQAQLRMAQIDLERTRVVAPADGSLINLGLREGNYVEQGKAVLSLVKRGTFYVTGYFEETKLDLVHVGQAARIRLMGTDQLLTGKVSSIAQGIADMNTTRSDQLLPQVQQTFNWVRLAQRIPVDIALDPLPEDIKLSAGMTVSIDLETP